MATDVIVTQRAPTVARRLADAANRFLESLSEGQRATATFPFEGDERYFWHYTPIERNGLMLVNMTEEQQSLALALMETALGERATRQAHRIIALEPILREHEMLDQLPMRWDRNPARYWFSIFGTPGGKEPWGFRVGGHHIGIPVTVVDGDYISPLPLFLGANPATVKYGPEKGSRTLPEEEDLPRALLKSLDADQRSVAVVDPVAPADILTVNYRSVKPEMTPVGIELSGLRDGQREQLVRIVRHYVDRATPELASQQWERIERAGLERVTFAWAGPDEPGQGHYYAIKGPTFLIEYDNTQNNANHIHSVWRDFTNDWGEDLLARHYAESHRH